MARRFESVSSARPSEEEPLTVITYNILADKYATSGMHTYCRPQLLAWPERRLRIVRELQGYSADVLALQEVEQPALQDTLLPGLPGYEAHYFGRRVKATDPVQGPQEGLAVLTKRERIDVLDVATLRFADHIPESTPADACRDELEAQENEAPSALPFDCNLRPWGREDGAVLALLFDRKLRRSFVFGATHLHWDPRWPDVKLLQAQILTAEAAAFLNRHKDSAQPLPSIIAGDFNSLWRKQQSDPFDQVPPGAALTSGVYDLLTTGRVGSSHHDHPYQRAKLRGHPAAAWKKVPIESALAPLRNAYLTAADTEPPLSTRTATFSGLLDYIWLGWNWAVMDLLDLPYTFQPGADAGDVTDIGPLPDERFPSDHLAMGVRLLPPCDLFAL